MSDDLTISGGGSVAVASDSLLAQAAALEHLAAEARAVESAVAVIDRATGRAKLLAVDAPHSAFSAEAELDVAQLTLGRVASSAAELGLALRLAASAYGLVDAAAHRSAQFASAGIGYLIGLLSPLALAALAAAAPALLLGAASGWAISRRLPKESLESFMTRNNEFLTNPTTVAIIRSAVMSMDDVAAGVSRIPPPLAQLLGDEGLGITGLGVTSALMVGAGTPWGLLRGSAVTVRATESTTGAAVPHGFVQRMDRVPVVDDRADMAQMRIDRYSVPGQPDRFELYIAGTVDFSPAAVGEPFDLGSNVAGVGGLPMGSYDAVRQALAQAGVSAESPLAVVGYSQGGLVASVLAASGDYNVRSLVEFGAPAGQIIIPAEVPAVIIENTDDLVPALGGAQSNTDAVIIQRHAFSGGDIPEHFAVPAHHYDQYRRTGELADAPASPSVVEARQRIADFTAGATTVDTTFYRADRVYEPGAGPGAVAAEAR